MSRFLIIFLSLYGSMHVYAFIRVRRAFSAGFRQSSALAALAILMTLVPLLVRMAEGSGMEQVARYVAWPGYIWMGAIFIFCTVLAVIDSLRLVWRLLQYLTGAANLWFLTPAVTCKAALAITLVAGIYSLYEARTIRTDHVTISTDKLLPSVRQLRIVQISDVHAGLLVRETRLDAILEAVRAANPDILISTGDLVDGRLAREDVTSHLDRMAEMIAAVPARYGKFAITGNHEFYAGIKQAEEYTRKAGFTVLRNQAVELPEGITICGVDDAAAYIGSFTNPEIRLVKNMSPHQFLLLLKHRPVVVTTGSRHVDLQLSGHVHNGQIFPFNLIVRMEYPTPCGTSTAANGSMIHVSRGSGTWGPPMRLFAPPEVTVIDIINTTPGP